MTPVEMSAHVAPTGRFKNEIECARMVKRMLESIKLGGTYALRITEKIHGSPEHLGIQFREEAIFASVRLKVQFGDNGTRFVCYLTCEDKTPSVLIKLFSQRIVNWHWKEGDVYPRDERKQTETVVSASSSELPTAEPSEELKVGSGRLSPYVHDPELRDIVISAVRAKFGETEFKGRDFHIVIASLAGQPAPTTQASGQLIRRYCELGLSVRTKKVELTCFYRLVTAEEQFQLLRAAAAEIEKAKESLAEVQKQEKICAAQKRALLEQLEKVEQRAGELVEERIRWQAVIDDPIRRDAKHKVVKIDAILKK